MRNQFFIFSWIKQISTQLDNRPTLKLASINTAWLIGDKILRLGVGLIIGVWIARYLGPEQYGVLAQAVAILAILQAFSALGLDNIVVQQVAQSPESAYQVLGTALVLRLLASLFSVLVVLLIGFVLYKDDFRTLIVLFLVASSIIFQSADVIDLWFQSQSQSRRTVTAKGVAYVCTAVLKVGLIVSSAPLWSFAAAQSIELAISAVALRFSYNQFKAPRKWKWQASRVKALMSQSFPLLLSGLSIVVYMKSSQVIVSQLLDHRALGLYSTAQMLSELWYFMPMTIATSAAPFIARQKRISEADYNNTFEQIFRFMWLLSIGLATLICLNSSFIVEILYGKAYAEAAAVLAVHTFTLIPVSIGVIQSLWLVNENKGKIAICQALVGAVASVLLNLYLIPKFGILGGAVAILISQTFQAFAVNALFVSELFKLQFRSLFSVLTSILEFFYTLCARCLSK